MKEEEWPPITPLDTQFGPPFPVEALPEPLQAYAKSLAEAYQVPCDLPAMLMLNVASVPLSKRIQINPGTEWFEPCNLYIAVVLPPASRKSAIFKAVTAPLEYYEKSQIECMAEPIATATLQHNIVKKSIKHAEQRAANAMPDEQPDIMREAQELQQQLPEIPKAQRILVDDISPEKLASMLAKYDGRLALMSAEGGVFDIISGRYSNSQPNLDVYLKGHAGDTLRVDRVGREPDFVESPALNIGLTIQPDVLRGLANKPGFRGRGLLARFCFVMPRSGIGYRQIETPHVQPWQRAAYHNLISELFRKMEKVDPAPTRFTLNQEAKELFQSFRTEIEQALAPGGRFEHISDWAGKYPGMVARVAAILHAVEQGHEDQMEKFINMDTMRNAITIGEYLAEHALIAFRFMGADSQQEAANYVLNWITRMEKHDFSLRDARQSLKGRYKDRLTIENALEILEIHGYIQRVSVKNNNARGRKPSPKYIVNPEIHSHNSQNVVNINNKPNSENNENKNLEFCK